MPFDPSQLPNILFWLDASRSTSLTTDSSAAGPALGNIADGGSVGSWYDASGNGHDFSQTTAGSQPTYHASGGGLAGHPFVLFPAAQSDGSGPYLTERAKTLNPVLAGSNTILMLLKKLTGAEAGYQVLFTNAAGGPQAEFLIHNGNATGSSFERYNAGSNAAMSESAVHGLAYSFNSGTNKESFYVDSAAAPGFTTTAGRPGMYNLPFDLGATQGQNCANAEFYEVIGYSRELSNSEIAQVYGFWNTKYGTTLNASAGTLTAPSVAASAVTQTTQTITASAPVGGTSPYTYQWFRSTTPGSSAAIAVPANAVAGATSLTLADTGLTAQTTYNYVLKVTDAASTTVLTAPLASTTHGTIICEVAFIGDSITIGAGSGTNPVDQFVLAMQAAYPRLDVRATNGAVSGEHIRRYSRVNGGSGDIAGLASGLASTGVPYLAVMEGTNDWNAGQQGDATSTAANYKADVQDIAAATTAAGVTLYVNQLIYRAGGDDPTTGIPSWNAQLASLTYGGKLRQGDTAAYAYFKAHQSELGDGLHPTSQGDIDLGGLWAAAMGPSIAADLIPPAVPTLTISPTTATAIDGGAHVSLTATLINSSAALTATVAGGGTLSTAAPTSGTPFDFIPPASGSGTATVTVASATDGKTATATVAYGPAAPVVPLATGYVVLIPPGQTAGVQSEALVILTTTGGTPGGAALSATLTVTLADPSGTFAGAAVIPAGSLYGTALYTPTTAGTHTVAASHIGGNVGMADPTVPSFVVAAASSGGGSGPSPNQITVPSGVVGLSATLTTWTATGAQLEAIPGLYAGRRLLCSNGSTVFSDPIATHGVATVANQVVHTFTFAAPQKVAPPAGTICTVI